MIRENLRKVPSGYLMLVVLLVLQLATFYWVFTAIVAQSIVSTVVAMLGLSIGAIRLAGFFANSGICAE